MAVGGKTQLHQVRLHSNQNFLIKDAYSSRLFGEVFFKGMFHSVVEIDKCKLLHKLSASFESFIIQYNILCN